MCRARLLPVLSPPSSSVFSRSSLSDTQAEPVGHVVDRRPDPSLVSEGQILICPLGKELSKKFCLVGNSVQRDQSLSELTSVVLEVIPSMKEFLLKYTVGLWTWRLGTLTPSRAARNPCLT